MCKARAVVKAEGLSAGATALLVFEGLRSRRMLNGIEDPDYFAENRILLEEAGAYFAGQKPLQDVVDIIAVRLQTYLDENA